MTLTKKFGLLLLLPFFGAITGVGFFIFFLDETSDEAHFINVAGRQRMLAADIRAWANMVAAGQEGDREGLRGRIAEFERTLTVLRLGGPVLEGALRPAPPEVQGDLAVVLEHWGRLKPELETVVAAPRTDPRFDPACRSVETGIRAVGDASQHVVSTFEARVRRLRLTTLGVLATLAAATGVVALVGFWLMRRFIVRPILRLDMVAQRIAGGDFSQRLEVTTRDELATLARTFNDMTGEVERLLAVLEDEKRKTEVERDRFQGLIEGIDAVLLEVDLEKGRFLYVSPRAKEMYGYPLSAWEEGFEGFWASRLHPEDRDAVIKECTGHGVGDSSHFFEYRFHRADDRWIWVKAICSPAQGEGPPGRRQYLLMIDTTARREAEERLRIAEERLRQAQKMEAVGQLAGGVAHDFNNLLTVMGGYAQLALGRIPEKHPVHQPLTEIAKAASKAAAVTRQLLAFSRRQILQPRPTNLNDVVSEMETLLRRLIGEDVEMRTTLDPLLATVNVDPSQMQQVLMNLAINARDAMPEGGRLTIETTNVVLTESHAEQHPPMKGGAYVLLAVTDSGVGMDEKTRSRIFEPFFTTKEMGKGTGLGLATVYGIVKQSGGFVWVYSEPGHGACFKVYLPRIEGPAGKDEAVRHSPVLGGTETILVVEDEEGVRRLACESLASYGYNVIEARAPAEVDGVLDDLKGPLHLLLTDVVLPGGSGRKVAELVRARFPGVAVLFMSGYTQNAIVHNGRLDPGIRLIEKPFAPTALAARVREVLDSSRSGGATP